MPRPFTCIATTNRNNAHIASGRLLRGAPTAVMGAAGACTAGTVSCALFGRAPKVSVQVVLFILVTAIHIGVTLEVGIIVLLFDVIKLITVKYVLHIQTLVLKWPPCLKSIQKKFLPLKM